MKRETRAYRAGLDTDADGQADSQLSLRFSADGSTLRGSFSSSESASIGPHAIKATIQGVAVEHLHGELPPVGFTQFVPLGRETETEISEIACEGPVTCNVARRGEFVGYELRSLQSGPWHHRFHKKVRNNSKEDWYLMDHKKIEPGKEAWLNEYKKESPPKKE